MTNYSSTYTVYHKTGNVEREPDLLWRNSRYVQEVLPLDDLQLNPVNRKPGNVERKPDLLWRNSRYVWDDEPLDENKWKDSVFCPECEFSDCGFAP